MFTDPYETVCQDKSSQTSAPSGPTQDTLPSGAGETEGCPAGIVWLAGWLVGGSLVGGFLPHFCFPFTGWQEEGAWPGDPNQKKGRSLQTPEISQE